MKCKLYLIRHGQSTYNLENRFTGWKDVPLTKIGIAQAKAAGQLMMRNNINIHIIFSSVLQRANHTAEIALQPPSCIQAFPKLDKISSKQILTRRIS